LKEEKEVEGIGGEAVVEEWRKIKKRRYRKEMRN
jgi:hypothetical protein